VAAKCAAVSIVQANRLPLPTLESKTGIELRLTRVRSTIASFPTFTFMIYLHRVTVRTYAYMICIIHFVRFYCLSVSLCRWVDCCSSSWHNDNTSCHQPRCYQLL